MKQVLRPGHAMADMRLIFDSQRVLAAPGGRDRLRTGRIDGVAYAATAPTVESGQRRANRVPNARFADVADWTPLELFSSELAARRSLGRHLRGKCRVTTWVLRGARVLVVLNEDDLRCLNTTWQQFEGLNEPDSRRVAEFVRCTESLDGLVTRAMMAPRARHVVLVGDPFKVAERRDAALRPTLPDPPTTTAGDD